MKQDPKAEAMFMLHLQRLSHQREDVERRALQDPELARFALGYDFLVLRGVAAEQAARTVSLLMLGKAKPDLDSNPAEKRGDYWQSVSADNQNGGG